MFLDHPSSRNQESSPSFSRPRFQAQVFKNKISSPRTKRGQEAQPLPANLKRGQRTHQKEAHSPPIPATNMPTTTSQSKAMSTPPVSPVLEEPNSPKSTSSQETPRSIPSINSTTPLDNLLSPGWTHAITIIMGHPLKSEIGLMLQKRVLYHLIHDPTDFWLSWDPSDPEDIRLLQKYAESNGSIAYLPSTLVKNLIGLWEFMNLLIKQDRPDDEKYNKLYYLMDDQWTKLTAYDMRSALIDEKQEKQNSHMSSATPCHMPHLRSPTSPVPVRSPMYLELASFKKSIKREVSAYSTLKDERYFDKFQRDLFTTAKSHDVSEILDPTFTPGPSPEEQELFEAKQIFMYKVFNETLLTDMGRTKVRKYLKTTDAQAVWKEYSEYMTTSSKGASEKRKITHYLTNTVLDSQFRGTTQQFVLHFNEQFRRLDDLTDISKRLPESIKMALLQNAVKDIPQLSIVETLDEYTSTTCGDGSFTHLNYSSYYNLLINACVRYDATKTSTPSKRRNVYAASGTQDFNTCEESYETHFFQDIDTPPDDFYQVHQTKHSRKPPTPLSGFQKDHSRKPSPSAPKKPSKKYDGPVYVPAEIYKLLSPEAVVALKKYNSAINKMAKKRGIHVTDDTDHELSIAETSISEEQANPHQDVVEFWGLPP